MQLLDSHYEHSLKSLEERRVQTCGGREGGWPGEEGEEEGERFRHIVGQYPLLSRGEEGGTLVIDRLTKEFPHRTRAEIVSANRVKFRARQSYLPSLSLSPSLPLSLPLTPSPPPSFPRLVTRRGVVQWSTYTRLKTTLKDSWHRNRYVHVNNIIYLNPWNYIYLNPGSYNYVMIVMIINFVMIINY